MATDVGEQVVLSRDAALMMCDALVALVRYGDGRYMRWQADLLLKEIGKEVRDLHLLMAQSMTPNQPGTATAK